MSASVRRVVAEDGAVERSPPPSADTASSITRFVFSGRWGEARANRDQPSRNRNLPPVCAVKSTANRRAHCAAEPFVPQ